MVHVIVQLLVQTYSIVSADKPVYPSLHVSSISVHNVISS